MSRNIFGLSPLVERKDDYYSRIQTPGIMPEVPNTPMLAGRMFDPEEAKQYTETFGKEYGPLLYWSEVNKRRESDPQRLKEQLDVLGPYFENVARESQRLGMEANLFAGFMDIPNKFSRALAAQHYYMPETMRTIAGDIGRQTPFVNRQYIQL